MDRPHEYCGIFGVFNHPDAARLTYYGLHALQHRGQESAGIVTLTYDERRERKVLLQHKGLGLVTDVFASPELFDTYLHGDSAIGHNRYSTTGPPATRPTCSPSPSTIETATWLWRITATSPTPASSDSG